MNKLEIDKIIGYAKGVIASFYGRLVSVILLTILIYFLVLLILVADIARPEFITVEFASGLKEALFRPQLQFISDLGAFIGVVLAIAVPLGIETLDKVSRSYARTRVLRKRLLNEWQMQWLIPLFLVIVSLSLGSRLFLNDASLTGNVQRAITFLLLILLLAGLVAFAQYLNRLYTYTLDQERIKREINKALQVALRKRNKQVYLDLIEGYGDILVSEAERSNLKALLEESLPELESITKLVVPEGSLEEIEPFILSDDFFLIYNMGEHKSSGKRTNKENASDDALDLSSDDQDINYADEANLRLRYDPDRYLITYTSTIQQFIRVYNAGQAADDISRKSLYSLIRLLIYFSKQEGRGLYIQLILRRLSTIAQDSALHSKSSMYVAAIDWYIETVFDKFGRTEAEFRLEYLPTFDAYLLGNLRSIIR